MLVSSFKKHILVNAHSRIRNGKSTWSDWEGGKEFFLRHNTSPAENTPELAPTDSNRHWETLNCISWPNTTLLQIQAIHHNQNSLFSSVMSGSQTAWLCLCYPVGQVKRGGEADLQIWGYSDAICVRVQKVDQLPSQPTPIESSTYHLCQWKDHTGGPAISIQDPTSLVLPTRMYCNTVLLINGVIPFQSYGSHTECPAT